MNKEKRFYTYAYLREDGTPYYIGKGTADRAYRDNGKPCSLPKDRNQIIILKNNLFEEEAFKHEIYMIAVFGRKDMGTGILRNKSSGGGNSAEGRIVSKETRKKISDKLKGTTIPVNVRKKISQAGMGRVVTEETRRKISVALKSKNIKKSQSEIERIRTSLLGRKVSEETRKKLSIAGKRLAKPHKITFKDGSLIIVSNIRDWCKENGYAPSGMYDLKNGRKKFYRQVIKVENI